MDKNDAMGSGIRGVFQPLRRLAAKSADSVRYSLLRAAMNRFPERKLFCPIPFKMMEIERSGNTNLCCWLPRSPGSIHSKGVMEIWNSQDAREIRSSILDGTFRYCDLERCPYFSSGNLPLQKNITEGPYAEIVRRGITVLETTKVFLAMDPRCNLRCISCRNDFAVIDEQEKATVHRSMEAVKDDISRITAIGLAGSGDPLVSPETREFLFSHDSSRTPHLKLYILTNGLLLNRKCWQQMEASRRAVAAIQVSIDAATAETYQRIRIGGSFASLKDNLSFIGELRQGEEIGEFIISFVVNALNYREMPLFARMGFDLGCDQIAFSYMSDWLNLSREDYRELAVHLPGHREYGHLREILNDPVLGDPRVFLHNLSGLKGGRIMGESMFV